MTGRIPKRAARFAAAVLATAGALAMTAGAASAEVIYNDMPSPFPVGMNSWAFQATQTSEFGGQVQFAGTRLGHPTVVVGMSSWACQSGSYSADTCSTVAGATFPQAVTLKVYAVGPGNAPALPALTEVTKAFNMPYRPSASAKCTGAEAGKWYSKGECWNERAFKIKFSNLNVVLPKDAIISVSYNTTNYGPDPVGTQLCNSEPQGCPYNSLNVAVRGPWEPAPRTPTVGSDPLPESTYLKSTTAGNYCENPGAVGTFAISQNCWTEEQPAIEVTGTLIPTAYVAIGDSLGYGYKETTFNENFPAEPASAFEGGYVGEFAKKLAPVEKLAGNVLSTINLSCPGETSGGMIGNGPLGSGLEASRAAQEPAQPALHVSSPCGYQNVYGFPLKTALHGASELENAVGILNAGVSVKAVTINMGSNDELESVGKCANPAYDGANGFTSFNMCLLHEASLLGYEYPGGLFTHIITNVGTAIGVLRANGYAGPVVVLGFYNPQALFLAGSDTLQKELNAHFEGAITGGAFGPGVKYANPFPVFNPEGEVKEKAALEKYTEEYNPVDIAFNNAKEVAEKKSVTNEGDIHPTQLGYTKLGALAWAAF